MNIPIFHLGYHGIGQGVLGGKVISHYKQAKSMWNQSWVQAQLSL